ncbi:hypothetical protein CYMTET_50980 [Cymbomonas tetramitiformis]|uniref:Cyclic nucleotide-binding domain-containing protein n=1 Tax=Cymbomonas tetramitiformis TaxID=36881 RepID=A0AAE0BLZ5_9CHLO|nr:hypothetical protein CYMTET_50980 [Cymbomonas tetramitiformis]
MGEQQRETVESAPVTISNPEDFIKLAAFQQVPLHMLRHIEEHVEFVSCDAGSTIFLEGDDCKYWYAIVEGKAAICRRGGERSAPELGAALQEVAKPATRGDPGPVEEIPEESQLDVSFDKRKATRTRSGSTEDHLSRSNSDVSLSVAGLSGSQKSSRRGSNTSGRLPTSKRASNADHPGSTGMETSTPKASSNGAEVTSPKCGDADPKKTDVIDTCGELLYFLQKVGFANTAHRPKEAPPQSHLEMGGHGHGSARL